MFVQNRKIHNWILYVILVFMQYDFKLINTF